MAETLANNGGNVNNIRDGYGLTFLTNTTVLGGGSTAPHYASMCSNETQFRLLLEDGSNIDAANQYDGSITLNYAVYYQRTTITAFLV